MPAILAVSSSAKAGDPVITGSVRADAARATRVAR
jgi:hypothetical protein